MRGRIVGIGDFSVRRENRLLKGAVEMGRHVGKKPLRVLYVLNAPTSGGPATSLATVLRHLNPGDVSPIVYSPGRASSEVFRRAGIPVVEGPVSVFTHFVFFMYRGRDWMFFLKELLLLPFHVLRFAYVLARYPCDVVHLNEGNLLAAALLAKLFGKRVVCHIRSVLPRDDVGFRMRTIRWAYRHLCDALVAIDATAYGPVRDMAHARIVNNPVQVEIYAGAESAGWRERCGGDGQGVYVAMLGRAELTEGLREFIGAAREVRRRGSGNIRFVWVGSNGAAGPGAGRLLVRLAGALGLTVGRYQGHDARELVRALDLEEMFLFIPYQRRVWSVYKEMDIVVTGGISGLGRQPMEAAASGKPVIGLSDSPSSDLILDGVNGRVVPLGRPDLLAERVLELAEDPALRIRMGRRGQRLAYERFHPAKAAQRFTRLYQELCA